MSPDGHCKIRSCGQHRQQVRSQAVVASLDIKASWLGGYQHWSATGGTERIGRAISSVSSKPALVRSLTRRPRRHDAGRGYQAIRMAADGWMPLSHWWRRQLEDIKDGPAGAMPCPARFCLPRQHRAVFILSSYDALTALPVRDTGLIPARRWLPEAMSWCLRCRRAGTGARLAQRLSIRPFTLADPEGGVDTSDVGIADISLVGGGPVFRPSSRWLPASSSGDLDPPKAVA